MGLTPPSISRRFLLKAAPAALLLAPSSARAAEWPTRTVKVVVPYLAGGLTDTGARITAEHLAKELGQSFIIENRVGASGNIATESVIRGEDDHTLLFAVPSQLVIAPLLQKLSFDPRRQLKPVARVFGSSFVLAVHPSLGVKTLPEFVAKVRANPGRFNYGSNGRGGIIHLVTEWLKQAADLDIVHVPYTGSPPLIADLVTGRVQAYIGNYADLVPQAQAGKVDLIAVTAPQRIAELPAVETIAETYPNFTMVFWNGYCASRAVPDAAVMRVSTALRGIMARDEVVSTFRRLGVQPIVDTPQEFSAELDRAQDVFQRVITAAKISL